MEEIYIAGVTIGRKPVCLTSLFSKSVKILLNISGGNIAISYYKPSTILNIVVGLTVWSNNKVERELLPV